jgi:hypothetical protein
MACMGEAFVLGGRYGIDTIDGGSIYQTGLVITILGKVRVVVT